VLKEYLKLSRSFNAGLTAIAPVLGALSNGEESLVRLVLFFLVGFFGHCYGFALNDIVDYRIDKLSGELADRPLISGMITVGRAWAFTVFMLLCSFAVAGVVAVTYGAFPPVLLLVASALSITVYDFISKKLPAMDIFVGLGVLLLILYGAFTVEARLSDLAVVVAALGTIEVLFMQFIAGGLKDAEHDFRGNARTLAVRLGVRVADGRMTVPVSLKGLAVALEGVFFAILFYPFAAFEGFRNQYGHIAALVVLGGAMLYAGYRLVSATSFDRPTIRRYIGLHYFINFSLVPVMLSVLNPYIALIAFIPPLAFVLSNVTLHGSLLPQTM
jgi:4-hydroxybenzoate polyprenyltransferase